MKKRLPQWLVLLAAAIYASGCAVGDAPNANRSLPTDLENNAASLAKGGGGIASVVVTPATSSIAAGTTIQLTARAFNANGGVKAGAKFAWSSTNNAVAVVNSAGLVTGVAVGTATIRATALQSGVSGTASVTVTSAPPTGTETLIAAGDIAVCTTPYDEATANLLDSLPGTIAVLGDNAYPDGSTADYANCYEPTWGRHKARTKPSIGNHEYQSPGGAPYFAYFGASAGSPSQGYYSYNLGAWHIIVLNSNCGIVACTAGSAQETWLRADLAANTKACVLAYWHHPRFSSDATHGNNLNVAPFWAALYEYRADVVLNGHAHVYERFARQTPAAIGDASGIRQVTVGTGGRSPLYGWSTVKANSEVRNNQTFGVLKLTLGATNYSWNFVPVAGSTWTDSGITACH